MATEIQVTIDCADPDRLAAFWADALRYKLEPPPAGFADWDAYRTSLGVPDDDDGGGAALVDPDGAGPRIWLQKVLEAKVVKNRVHLDLDASGGRSVPVEARRERVRAEANRLVGIGATELYELEEGGGYFVTLQDPEGNEFCVH